MSDPKITHPFVSAELDDTDTDEVRPSDWNDDHVFVKGADDYPEYIRHDLSTAANDFLVASGVGAFVKKTLAEVGAILEGDIVHGNIQTLDADDHAQYALLAGRAGGQTLIGGTASGNNLELHSTSHATKGLINLGDTAYVDEVNNRLGIGTILPDELVTIQKDTGGVALLLKSTGTQSSPSLSFESDFGSDFRGSVTWDGNNERFNWIATNGFSLELGALLFWGTSAGGGIKRNADGLQLTGRDGVFLNTKNDNTKFVEIPFGNVRLKRDGIYLGFGADSDITLTHVHDTGLLLNTTNQLQFGDSGTYIYQSVDGQLDLVSDGHLILNAGSATKTIGGRVITTDRHTSNQTLNSNNHIVAGNTNGGGFTITFPAGIDGTHYITSNVGRSGNVLTISPDGAELLGGVNEDFDILDGETIDWHYETTEGWVA